MSAHPAGLASPRYELIPLRGAVEQLAHVPPGAVVAVTASARRGLEPMLRFTEEVQALGFAAAPHLPARDVRDGQHLAEILARLQAAGVKDIFVPAGDREVPLGPFRSSLDLLRAMAELSHGLEQVGIAGYPEGHPFIPEAELWAFLEAKAPYATYMVTQMCFSAAAIGGWLASARVWGVQLPAYIGVAGIKNRQKLLRLSLKIGVGESVRFLSKHTDLVGRFFSAAGYDMTGVVGELLPHLADPAMGVAGLHVYTFNEVQEAAAWVARLEEEFMAGTPAGPGNGPR